MIIDHPHADRQISSPARSRERAVIDDPQELLRLLGLDPALLPGIQAAARSFPLRVPRSYVARMRRGEPDDPLLRQVLPSKAELARTPGFVADPVADREAMASPGVLHKYHGRVLLIACGACSIHCRFCFRRCFPFREASLSANGLRAALSYISQDGSINEVILSGGDPLSLSNHRLGQLLDSLDAIPHLERLRIHSRQPIVQPERVDHGLVALLDDARLKPVVVVHANHPQEIDDSALEALRRLAGIGVPLFNQSVLLEGVNDSAQVLAGLSECLFHAGVVPYYLHLLDRVQGSAHFEIAEHRAMSIMQALRSRLPGYLVPRLVREQAGKPAKTLIAY